MKPIFAFLLASLASVSLATAQVKSGTAAPDFSLTDSNGKTVKLSDYSGKMVILEWTNADCPFVKKHYGSNNMQKLQKEMTDKGIVWLSIISSAPGSQGYCTGEEANAIVKEKAASPTGVLLDPEGVVGRSYEAKTTPHLFVIDKAGLVQYQGAIDNDSSPKPEAVATATNYVRQAVGEIEAGKPVSAPITKPYGCSVKYGAK